MNSNLVVRSSVVLILAMALWCPGQTQSAEPAGGTVMMEGKMMTRCQEMKDQKKKMAQDVKAQDAELTEQVAKMNHAPEGQKVKSMAALITRMAEQRIAMDARKAKNG